MAPGPSWKAGHAEKGCVPPSLGSSGSRMGKQVQRGKRSSKGWLGEGCWLAGRSQGVAVNFPSNHTSTWVGFVGWKYRANQALPLPTLLYLPFWARLPQIQTAPNFDSFVTTVPVRLSQAVQTEDIYRCVGDTDIHTMTHILGIHVGPDPPAPSPGFGHLDTNGPQTPQERHLAPDTDGRRLQTRTPGTDCDPDTQRDALRPRDTDTHTPQTHGNPLTETETHSATHTPDTEPKPQTPRRPDSVSHARHPPSSQS